MRKETRFMGCDDLRLARAIQHVSGDLTKRTTLIAAAAVAGLEPTYFCKCFRRFFGLCFSEWNTRIRMEEAQRLLSTTKLPINAVALAVGYSDVTTFTRNFRKVAFASPRQYRRQAAKNASIAENFTSNAETAMTKRH